MSKCFKPNFGKALALRRARSWPPRKPRGAALIVVMVVLTIVSLLGVSALQISTMSERAARNDRDQQLAWQAAEAALTDAEADIFGPGPSSRRSTFSPSINTLAFMEGCGTSGSAVGLCKHITEGKPAWLTVDFLSEASNTPTAAYGTYTGKRFAAGPTGTQPARVPRYIIEPIRDPGDRDLASTEPRYVYRVTAMGFGPRADIQAVMQMIYRN